MKCTGQGVLKLWCLTDSAICRNCKTRKVMKKCYNSFIRQLNDLKSSSIEHGGTRPFFHMVDRYFGNDSLEPFENKFIGSTGLAMAYLWLSWPSLMRGYETIFQYVGIFVRYFLWRRVYIVFLAYDNGMGPP